uniref:non-specific serine/threonine protein kinase n=1 Tax=Astatotilapia calliptera TaxID=8154 RepID=A0A3P8R104_ASTCA
MENYIAKLNEYAQKQRLALQFVEVGAAGPDHIKTFTIRVVLNGKAYPDAVGKNKKEAKQNAAKNALAGLLEESADTTENAAEVSNTSVHQRSGSNIKYTCWLNEYGQRNRVIVRPVEAARPGPDDENQWCNFFVGDKEYPAASGKTRREAKEEAAKLVYHDICGTLIIDLKHGGSSRQTVATNSFSFNVWILFCCSKTKSLMVKKEAEIFTEENFIGLINLYCQKTKHCHDYVLVSKCGPPHNPQFFYKVVIDNKEYPVGEGKTIKEAKQNAARQAWSALQEQSNWDSKLVSWSAVSDDVTPVQLSSPASTLIFSLLAFVINSNTYVNLYRFTLEFDSIERLGKGAFGRVYKAKHKLLNKYYAIKIVRCKEKSLREVVALSDLHHTNIVRYYTCWIQDLEYQMDSTGDTYSTSQSASDSSEKCLYIQMELCDTKTLRVWIDEKNTQNVKKSLRDSRRKEESLIIAQQIASGVEYIHSKMLIHRDLKPANIMFGRDGEVKIGDFGLVTAEIDNDAENLLERSAYKGTPSYMAPEQKSKSHYDRKVDIFALGLIYFELLWNLPVGPERKAVWDNARSQKLPQGFLNNFPQEHQIIKAMLCAKPENRPEASKLKEELKEYSDALLMQKQMLRNSNTV